ncbi:hypothetical protein, conserved [Eimeria tenella]|uniref:Uncharacterized protein n=1 Tax=Eimeria tenella TaxID=5802 RepID=U6L183_EIMTE|nr:hypothetical protein, conserved [Eimeria tenella]CDJ42948.1 hypothetical protein, conserved [Eimeria tenella]|eukprot:XP_013233698.1 hypothetical protein, conserved [Eimeria tenella]
MSAFAFMWSDVREQINKKLKEALEEKARETEATKSFFVEMEALIALRDPARQRQGQEAGGDKTSIVDRVSCGIHHLFNSFEHSQQQLQCASECIQQLQKEKQQLEKQLMDARVALREAEAERQKHDETKKQRDALTAQTEAQQRSLEQQALLIDGLKQRCCTLEAERRDLASMQSTVATGTSSSFRSLFASWGEGIQESRQRRGPDAETGDVMAYTLAQGLETEGPYLQLYSVLCDQFLFEALSLRMPVPSFLVP